jgi:hypothetical protein
MKKPVTPSAARDEPPEKCRQHQRGHEPRCRFCVAYLDAIGVAPPPHTTLGYDEDDDQPRDWGDL